MPRYSKLLASGILFFISILLINFCFDPAYANEDITTIATGVAVIQGDNITGAREEATLDALRQALEQGVGMMVESHTILNNDDLLEKIYTDTRGYIQRYEIITEKEKGKGLYSVKVQAIVKTGALRNTLVDMGIIKAMMDYPRVIILPSPDEKLTPEVESAEAVLIQQFTDKRFDLIDAEISSELHREAGQLLATRSMEEIAASLV